MLNYEYINNNKIETIVLLHGFGGNGNCFKKQVNELKQLFNILIVDMHGHGKSSHLHLIPKEYFTLKKISSDINTLLEKLSIHHAHFMGLSLGSIVANAFAYHYSEKVASLLHIGGIIKLRSSDKFLVDLFYKYQRYIPYMWIYYVAGYIIMPLKKHRKARNIFVTEARKMKSSDFFAWAKLMIGFEKLYPSSNLNFNFPTLYVSGAHDYVFIKSLQKHCEECKYSKIQLIETAGHICNIDEPEEFNKIMIDFYDSIVMPLVVNSDF